MSTAALRRPVDGTAAGLMVLLCFLWGFTHVFSKLAAPDISLVMQGGLRSAIAVALLCFWASARNIVLFQRDGTLGAGLIAGLLFAGEFLFIFAGLAHTGASRMVVFVYLAPCLTALGLHWLVPSERLSRGQWTGVWLAFGGVTLVGAGIYLVNRRS